MGHWGREEGYLGPEGLGVPRLTAQHARGPPCLRITVSKVQRRTGLPPVPAMFAISLRGWSRPPPTQWDRVTEQPLGVWLLIGVMGCTVAWMAAHAGAWNRPVCPG